MFDNIKQIINKCANESTSNIPQTASNDIKKEIDDHNSCSNSLSSNSDNQCIGERDEIL